MVFETSRTFGGRPFRLRDHLRRLLTSLDLAGIDARLDIDGLAAATQETIEANAAEFGPGEDFTITHNVSAGAPERVAEEVGLDSGANLSIHLWPLRQWHPERAGWYATGVPVVTPRSADHGLGGLDPAIKHRNRLAMHLAERVARAVDEGVWALLCDREDRITEGTTANFMMVKDGLLLSPPRERALAGITRETIIELARDAGIPFEEHDLNRRDVQGAEEAFFCATTFVIMPIESIDGRRVGQMAPGPITRELTAAFTDLVGLDFVAQAKHYADLK